MWLLAIKIDNKAFRGNVIAIYHSPSKSDAEFIEYFDHWCDVNLNREETNSLDLLSSSFYSVKVKNVIHSYGLKQLVQQPTRIVKQSKTRFCNK